MCVPLRHNAAIRAGALLGRGGLFNLTMQPNSGFGRLSEPWSGCAIAYTRFGIRVRLAPAGWRFGKWPLGDGRGLLAKAGLNTPRMYPAVQDRIDFDQVRPHSVEDSVGEAAQRGAPEIAEIDLVRFGELPDPGKRVFDLRQERFAKSGELALVPNECRAKIAFDCIR